MSKSPNQFLTDNKTPKLIAIAGNIGVGKTTLTQKLCKHFKWLPQFENIDDNPYLIDFYEDMRRWSFNLQFFFLQRRLKNILDIQAGASTYILDRTIYEDAQVFAPNLHDMGLMTSRDFITYSEFYNTIRTMIKPPDLIIYLKASVPTLVQRIDKRGREFESNISIDYLNKLNDYYNKWADSYHDGNLLVIDCDNSNFEDNPEDLGNVITKIESIFFGLF
ncbi:MAG: deoxynucleoside kinase [Alphaproteobacteria bacterium]|nr:deoxynucleoside kinase [Alphaproteobacteria bacterium]